MCLPFLSSALRMRVFFPHHVIRSLHVRSGCLGELLFGLLFFPFGCGHVLPLFFLFMLLLGLDGESMPPLCSIEHSHVGYTRRDG